MMIDLEQLKADREAGTDGPWKIVRYDCGDGDIPDNTPMIDGPDAYDAAVVHWKGFKQKYWSSAHGDDRAIDANASRISRLPELEAAYIEAVAKLDMAVEALKEMVSLLKATDNLRANGFVCDAVDIAIAAIHGAKT